MALFAPTLPSVWTDDPARCAKARRPEESGIAQTKREVALAELGRVLASGVSFGCALADADTAMALHSAKG